MTDWRSINVKPDNDREIILWIQDGQDSHWCNGFYFDGRFNDYILEGDANKIIAWADVTEPTVDQLNPEYKVNQIIEN